MRRHAYALIACVFIQISPHAVADNHGYVALKDESPALASKKLPQTASKNPGNPEANAQLLKWSSGEYPSRVAAALADGANVDATEENDPMQRCALHRAAISGSRATVKVLLSAHANIEQLDAEGKSALLLAAMNGEADTVLLLLHRGARADVIDKLGNSALHLIAASKRDDAKTAAMILARCRTLPVDGMNSARQTAAQIAVENQLLDLLTLLLDQGASVTLADPLGNPLLHQAASFTALWPVSTSLRIVERLLEKNAQADQKNAAGQTARQLARSTFIKRALERAQEDQGLRFRRK